MTRLVLVAALLTVACTKSPGPTPSGGSAESPTPTAEVPPAPASEQGQAPAAAAALPVELNASTSSLAGCLASPEGTEQAPRSRAAMDPAQQKPELDVQVVDGGIRVAHDLSHACCLKSKIETSVSGKTVKVTEMLSGTPCRCICSSTITTSVRLAPGEYTLEVLVDDNGQKRSTPPQKVVVK